MIRLQAIFPCIVVLAASLGAVSTQAQESAYRFDVGAAVGMSGYLGEANSSFLYRNPGFAAGASMRYLIDPRWSVRAMLMTAGLSGNSADMDNVFPGGETYRFTSQVYDLGVRAEFNFFNYGIGRTFMQLRRWSPFLSLGAGVTVASSSGTFTAFNVPVGVGVRYKLKPRINLGLELTMTKVFGDNVDGPVLDDLYQIKSSFVKNTDWYSTFMISLGFEIGERCTPCFYVD